MFLTKPILPKPVRDEYALGYICRLTSANQCHSSMELLSDLAIHFNLQHELLPITGRYFRAETHLRALALATDSTVFELLYFHSNLPSNGLTLQAAARWLHGSMHPRKQANPSSKDKHPYFCPQCIQAQVSTYSFPIWHRMHQLDGIYWCPTHKTVLPALNEWFDTNALMPTEVGAFFPTLAGARDLQKYPALESFCKVMLTFLRHPPWNSMSRIEGDLRRQAAARGMKLTDGATVQRDSTFLSGLAGSECPAWWLDEVFGPEGVTIDKSRSALDSVLIGGGRVSLASYALAIALLFSPQEKKTIRSLFS